jgi:hypothetical protein
MQYAQMAAQQSYFTHDSATFGVMPSAPQSVSVGNFPMMIVPGAPVVQNDPIQALAASHTVVPTSAESPPIATAGVNVHPVANIPAPGPITSPAASLEPVPGTQTQTETRLEEQIAVSAPKQTTEPNSAPSIGNSSLTPTKTPTAEAPAAASPTAPAETAVGASEN